MCSLQRNYMYIVVDTSTWALETFGWFFIRTLNFNESVNGHTRRC